MRTKMTALFVALMILIVSAGAVSAFDYVGKEYAGTMCQSTKAQSITLPSAAYLPSAEFKCTGSMDACVWVFKDSNLHILSEVPIIAGGIAKAPMTAFFAEVYYCYEGLPTCGDWANKACGGSAGGAICSKTEILQTRDCQKSVMYGGDKYTEGKCVSTMQCTAATCTPSTGAWSTCSNSKQTRTVTYADCGKTTETQSCAVGCTNPTGTAGQTRYDGGYNYVCNGLTAKWDKIADTPSQTIPEIVLVSSGAAYNSDKGGIVGTFKIKNNGASMTESYLIEMAIRKKGQALSVVSDQMTCDPTHPENVHKMYKLSSGETATVELFVSDDVLNSGEYDVYVLTAKKCYKDMSSSDIAAGKNYIGFAPDGKKITTVTISSGSNGNPTSTSSPIILMTASGAYFDSSKDGVIGSFTLENNGASMTESYLIEMAIRKKGQALAIVSDQMTCDPTHPENVHKTYKLNKGEKKTIELFVSNDVLGNGEYDVYVLTAKKCWKDMTQAEIDSRVGPAPNGLKITSLTIGNGGASPNIVLVSSGAIYDKEKGMVIGRATVKNTGGDMKETYLFEMQVKQNGKFLASVSSQSVCDSTHPENVHKLYALNSGEEIVIDFYVPDTELKDGEYEIYFQTARKCYKDLTPEQAAANYNYVGPLPDGKKITTVVIGDSKTNVWMTYAPFLVMLGGIVLAALIRTMPTTIIGIVMFIVGVAWWLWSLLR